jgi:hypothetical protein
MTPEQRQEFICKLDQEFFSSSESGEISNYFKILKTKAFFNKHKNCPNHDENSCDSEIKVISVSGEEEQTKFKVKYLHFDRKMHKRPPYYGTWRKKSTKIKPTKPFTKDDKFFDYEIDSDDEWEDEPEGESICDSEKGDQEDQEATKVEDEDEDSFMVPHGYLSDDELDEELRESDPQTKKALEASKSEQWENEQKKKSTSKHVKVLVAKWFMAKNYWDCPDEHLKNNSSDLKFLQRFKMVSLAKTLPIVVLDEAKLQLLKAENSTNATPSSKAKGSKKSADQDTETYPATKPSKTKSRKTLLGQHQTASSATPVENTQTPATTTTINKTPQLMTFISKMKNKISVTEIIALDNNNTKSKELASLKSNTASAPLSPKNITPSHNNTNNIAEKRMCSDNDDTAVKRLRLDHQETSCDEVKTLTVGAGKNGKKSLKFASGSDSTVSSSNTSLTSATASPTTQKPMSLFDKLSVKKTQASGVNERLENNVNLKSNKENEKDVPMITLD